MSTTRMTISVVDMAEQLGIARATFHRWISRGMLECQRDYRGALNPNPEEIVQLLVVGWARHFGVAKKRLEHFADVLKRTFKSGEPGDVWLWIDRPRRHCTVLKTHLLACSDSAVGLFNLTELARKLAVEIAGSGSVRVQAALKDLDRELEVA